MSPRTYNQAKRAATSEETRQRILQASLKLHAEKGFAATSWQDIAREADVAVGTVYFHFRSPDDLIPACSALGMSLIPPPTSAIFSGARSRAARIERLVDGLIEFYSRSQAPLTHVFAERHAVPAVGRLAEEILAHQRTLVSEALGEGASDVAVDIADAIVDFRTWQAMRERGINDDVVAAALVRAIRGTSAHV